MSLCRICLKILNGQYFDITTTYFDDIALIQLMECIAQITIPLSETFPRHVCIPCHKKLRNFYELREQIRRVEKNLNEKCLTVTEIDNSTIVCFKERDSGGGASASEAWQNEEPAVPEIKVEPEEEAWDAPDLMDFQSISASTSQNDSQVDMPAATDIKVENHDIQETPDVKEEGAFAGACPHVQESGLSAPSFPCDQCSSVYSKSFPETNNMEELTNFDDTQDEIREFVDDNGLMGLPPAKSKSRYKQEFDAFEAWMKMKNLNSINEMVLLLYFDEKSKVYQPSSLWSKYSMIKKMLLVNKDFNISSYRKLTAFLKTKSVGYKPKKAYVLSKEQIVQFITRASDEVYLMVKVALVFGIYGACRREELANMTLDDIEDRGNVLVVTIPNTETNKKRVFTIIDDDLICGLTLYRKYAAIRSRNVKLRRFFLKYTKYACANQPVGKNTFGSICKTIATFLQLPNPERYTGHTFRRTSATLLADMR